MTEDEFLEALNEVALYLDISILALLFIFEALVFYILKFKVDKSGIITLLLHLIISAFRVVRSIFDILQVISSILVWMSL
jgi:hypothetical protein